jgi:hypothetical protein
VWRTRAAMMTARDDFILYDENRSDGWIRTR